MRLIEQQMVEAIKAGHTWRSGNTAVRFGARDCMQVFLYGHYIADVDPSGGVPISFSLAGWNTVTTRSRINALLREFSRSSVYCRVSCKNFIPHYGGVAITASQWIVA